MRQVLGLDQGSRPLHPPEGGPTPSGKKGVDALLGQTVSHAKQRGLIPPEPRGAIDATGYETHHASRYYVWRQGKRRRQKFWPKWTVVLETASHLFLSAHVSRGPSQDSPQFEPTTSGGHGPLVRWTRCWGTGATTPNTTTPTGGSG